MYLTFSRIIWHVLLDIIIFLSLIAFCIIILTFIKIHIKKDDVNVEDKKRIAKYINIYTVLIVTIFFHLIFMLYFKGLRKDIAAYELWAKILGQYGPSKIYEYSSIDLYICDYPAGFLYYLWGIGSIFNALNISTIPFFFLALPSAICDIICTIVLYLIAKKYLNKTKSSLIALAYGLNMAILADSAIWGQTDSFFVFFTLLSVFFAIEKKWIPLMLSLMGGLLFKVQMMFIFPVIIAYLIFSMIKNKKTIIPIISGFFISIICFAALSLPFSIDQIRAGDYLFIFKRYILQLDSYSGFSMNAFNFYSAIGINFASYKILGIFGTIILILIVLAIIGYSVYMYLKNPGAKMLPLHCSLIIALIYCFVFGMHERYNLAIIPLLLYFYAIIKDEKIFDFLIFFSTLITFNQLIILFSRGYLNGLNEPVFETKILPVISMIIGGIAMVYVTIKFILYTKKTLLIKTAQQNKEH